MHSIRPVIASNGFAILLTVVFLLPITAILAFVASAPIDDLFAEIGVWFHKNYQWNFDEFDTIERFTKIGFALRAIVISVGVSFLYFWISNWLNHGLARIRAKGSIGKQSIVIESIQPWIFVGPALTLLLLFLLIPIGEIALSGVSGIRCNLKKQRYHFSF